MKTVSGVSIRISPRVCFFLENYYYGTHHLALIPGSSFLDSKTRRVDSATTLILRVYL
jgi:hypothetical protein